MTQTTSYVVSGVIWLIAIVLLGTYEWWAIATHHPTLSQWIWQAEIAQPWLRWTILVALAVLIWHFWKLPS